jgi:hypothetical protein
MIYSLHPTDLKPDARRVAPHPLVPQAQFHPAGVFLPADVAVFLENHDVYPRPDLNRWHVSIWNVETDDNSPAAQASFVWDYQRVICEAIEVQDVYHSLNLEPYIMQLGYGLWGVAYDAKKHPLYT